MGKIPAAGELGPPLHMGFPKLVKEFQVVGTLQLRATLRATLGWSLGDRRGHHPKAPGLLRLLRGAEARVLDIPSPETAVCKPALCTGSNLWPHADVKKGGIYAPVYVHAHRGRSWLEC